MSQMSTGRCCWQRSHSVPGSDRTVCKPQLWPPISFLPERFEAELPFLSSFISRHSSGYQTLG